MLGVKGWQFQLMEGNVSNTSVIPACPRQNLVPFSGVSEYRKCPSTGDVLAAVRVPYCTCVFTDRSDHSFVVEFVDNGQGNFQVSSQEEEHPVHLEQILSVWFSHPRSLCSVTPGILLRSLSPGPGCEQQS